MLSYEWFRRRINVNVTSRMRYTDPGEFREKLILNSKTSSRQMPAFVYVLMWLTANSMA